MERFKPSHVDAGAEQPQVVRMGPSADKAHEALEDALFKKQREEVYRVFSSSPVKGLQKFAEENLRSEE